MVFSLCTALYLYCDRFIYDSNFYHTEIKTTGIYDLFYDCWRIGIIADSIFVDWNSKSGISIYLVFRILFSIFDRVVIISLSYCDDRVA